MPDFLAQFIASGEMAALFQVIMIDLVMAGDNAIVIGMAAANVAAEYRKRVIFWGLCAAVILRIAMALVASQLMTIIGLTLAGGILLLWVSWRFYRDIRKPKEEDEGARVAAGGSPTNAGSAGKTPMGQAIWQIFVADVSMSLDNVLGVAGAAREHPYILAGGLLLSIILMGFAASGVAKILQRYHWVSYVGLLIVVYVALTMIWDGANQVSAAM
jgi:YjbE family integral membrane protein